MSKYRLFFCLSSVLGIISILLIFLVDVFSAEMVVLVISIIIDTSLVAFSIVKIKKGDD